MYYAQIDLEKKFSREYARKDVARFFSENSNSTFDKVIKVVEEFMVKTHEYEPITQCNLGVREYWADNDITVKDVVIEFFVAVAMTGRASFQGVIAQVVPMTGLAESDFVGGLRLCGQILSILDASGMLSVSVPTRRKELRFVELNFELPDYILKRIGNCAYMPPALLPLKPRSNSDAGWLGTKKSIFLNKNHHEGNAPLHWLDSLNSVAFSIDKNMLNYDEQVEIDITEDAQKLANFQGKRAITIRTIKEVLAHGNKFYFIHRFCARYRAYASGYALSPQGNDYRKALLNLHTQETLTNDYNF